MSSRRKTKKIALFILIALFMAGLVLGWYLLRPKSTSSLNASDSTKKKAEQLEVDNAKSPDNKNSNQQEQSTQQQSADKASSASVNITNAVQQGDLVVVNGLISGATSGSCNLTLTNGSNKIQKTVNIGFQVSYYICQGFSISSAEFNPKGEWTATINITTPNGSAQSEPRKVIIQ
jgi:hypothetical protein